MKLKGQDESDDLYHLIHAVILIADRTTEIREIVNHAVFGLADLSAHYVQMCGGSSAAFSFR